ncbi:MAG: endolytic transglycosylase MltG [Bdellovibrionales bacterium]|jgi:UPF0755 protein|nr:endolytic transglycosylase MltG [Bdellovibrionales bacterium]
MRSKIFIFFIGAPLLAFLLAGVRVYYQINHWSYSGPTTIFTINKGEGFSKINARLKSKGIIPSAKIFHRYSQFNGLLEKFKQGDYEIKSGMTMKETLDLLISGKSITIKVTIPEGKNIYEIGKIFEENKILSYKSFIEAAKNSNLVASMGIEGKTFEGYLYPDTYMLSKNSQAKDVIATMVYTFKNKTKGLDLSSSPFDFHSLIILASIVEKETGAKEERPDIAGVFLNRIRKKMRLQSDPTTIYGIYENFNGNLRKKHLLQKTPYNTYRINGLPIGPISNPGIEAIRAVLYPSQHNYLYFVSKNDGTHIFTSTYKDHLRAVKKWQLTYKNRAGKSWRDLKQD